MEWNGVERLESRKEGRKQARKEVTTHIWSGLVWSGLFAAECMWQATSLRIPLPHVFKMLSENVSIFTILALSRPASF